MENEHIECDLCRKKVTDYVNDLHHFSGIINGVFNTHIHVCKVCVDDLALPIYNFDTGSYIQT